jgi:hypothetical protein
MNYVQQSCRKGIALKKGGPGGIFKGRRRIRNYESMSFVKLAAGSVLSETEVEIPPAPLFPKGEFVMARLKRVLII